MMELGWLLELVSCAAEGSCDAIEATGVFGVS